MPSYQIQQLADLCRAHPLTPKLVLVPSIQAGSALGTTLARSGTNWIGLRFSTPEDLARQISEPQFIADGWSALPKDADLIEMAPVVRSYLDSPDNVYFRNQTFSQGLLRSIHRTVRALRIAGTSAESLQRHRNDHKLRAIAHLYVAYQDCLEDKKWYDGPDLFAAATARLEASPLEDTVVAILDETPLPGLAKQFVETLAGQKIVRIGRSKYGAAVPETVAGSGLTDRPLVTEIECEPAGRILSGLDRNSTLTNIELRHSKGPEVEIRSAFSNILETGRPLDDIEIACTTPDLLSYAYDVAHRLEVPATFATGISILQTRPGQAIRAALNWVASNGDPEWLDALQAGRLLNTDAGTPAALPKALADLKDLIDSDEEVPAARVSTLSAKLLREHVTTLTETEEPARDSLVNRFEQLAESTTASGTPSEMAGALIDVVDAHRFAPGAAKPGHIHIVPLERAGFTGRPYTYVLGLDNTSFPGAPGEDPLLLDHERSRISGDLEMLRTRPVAQVWHLVRLLGLAPYASLSASTYRLSDGQESEPAALFHHLAALTEPDKAKVDAVLPDPDPHLPDAATWTLSWAHRRGHLGALEPRAGWLFRGNQAEASRTDRTFSPYKGVVPSAAPDFRSDDVVWSASRLETLARCPYRFFWRYVLEIEPPEEDRDPTRWLTPLEFGSLLHKLFQRYMADAPDRDSPPDPDVGMRRIGELLEDLLGTWSQEIPPPSPLAYQVDVARLEAAARVFISEESRRPGDHKPRGFEVSFGFDDEGGLNEPAPVELEIGDIPIKFRGLIDRVDETDNGYVIWDYKTGSAFPYDESDLLSGGQHLQWALYAHAFGQMLRKRGIEARIASGYYFASDREHGRKMLAVPPTLSELSRTLHPVLGLAEKGAFPPLQKTDQCRFCDYKTICEKDQMLPKSVATVPGDSDPELLQLATEWLSN